MKLGVCVMANVDELGFFTHVEARGYDSVWVTDSQMLFSEECARRVMARV